MNEKYGFKQSDVDEDIAEIVKDAEIEED